MGSGEAPAPCASSESAVSPEAGGSSGSPGLWELALEWEWRQGYRHRSVSTIQAISSSSGVKAQSKPIRGRMVSAAAARLV